MRSSGGAKQWIERSPWKPELRAIRRAGSEALFFGEGIDR
jgi:hypothetical protein